MAIISLSENVSYSTKQYKTNIFRWPDFRFRRVQSPKSSGRPSPPWVRPAAPSTARTSALRRVASSQRRTPVPATCPPSSVPRQSTPYLCTCTPARTRPRPRPLAPTPAPTRRRTPSSRSLHSTEATLTSSSIYYTPAPWK